MFTKYAFVVLGVVIVLCSCNNKGKDENLVIVMLGDELEEANSKINTATKDLYWKLASKLEDVKLRERAAIYNSKALLVKSEAESVCNYLDSIKSVHKIPWNEINIRLKKCKENFIDADAEVKSGFFNDIKKIPFTLDSLYPENGYKAFLEKLDVNSRNAMLSKLKNGIKNLEYNILRHLDEVTTPGCNLVKFDYYNILVGQSTTHLKKGDILEISAGVGSYALATKPKIIIDGKNVDAIDAVGTLKKKVSGKIGKYFVPIKIEFTDENGIRQKRTEKVEYTIDP